MKLHLTTSEKDYLITGFGAGFIEVNLQRYMQNLVVMPQALILDWEATHFTSLSETHFKPLIAFKPEVVLLGTGDKHQFLHPKVFKGLTEVGIPLECMTSAAACRTYNILMSEGRNVAAALLIV